MSDCYEFDEAFQNKIAALILRDASFCQRTDGLIKPEYFSTEPVAYCVDMGLRYFNTYKKPPHKSVLNTLLVENVKSKKIRKDLLPEIVGVFNCLYSADISDGDYVVDKIVNFAQHQAIKVAILQCVDLLEKNDLTRIKKTLNGALNIGSVEDNCGYNYWGGEEIELRIKERININSGIIQQGITTGWPSLDEVLYGNGFERKAMSMFFGISGVGKTIALCEFSRNASLAGYNVLYITLEVARQRVVDRLDAGVLNTTIKSLYKTPLSVAEKLKLLREKAGIIEVREYPSGQFKPSMLRRLLEYYKGRSTQFDMVVIDYPGIMAPDDKCVNRVETLSSIFVNLRGLASEYDYACLVAGQATRASSKASIIDDTDIGEDYNQIRHVDLAISINVSQNEEAAGDARLFIAKARNSRGKIVIKIKQNKENMQFIKEVVSQ